jgi:hypothetical protein
VHTLDNISPGWLAAYKGYYADAGERWLMCTAASQQISCSTAWINLHGVMLAGWQPIRATTLLQLGQAVVRVCVSACMKAAC